MPTFDSSCRIVGEIDHAGEFRFVPQTDPPSPEAVEEEDDPGALMFSSGRAYYVDEATKNSVVLDMTLSSTVFGTIFDGLGKTIGIVNGTNDGPRRLRLKFIRDQITSSGDYVFVNDTFDGVYFDDAAGFRSRWIRTRGDDAAPRILVGCVKSCGPSRVDGESHVFDDAVSWIPSAFKRSNEGLLELLAPGRMPKKIINELRQNGVPVKLASAKIPTATKEAFLIEVPQGSERWAKENLPGKSGITSAKYVLTTAGGSYTANASMPDGTLIPSSWSPEKAGEMWTEAACKVKSVFTPHFRNVRVSPCQQSTGDFNVPEFCFVANLEGHTSDNGGFSSANLGRKVDDGFFIQSQVQLSAMDVQSKRSSTGYIERITYYVVTSLFARQKADVPPEKGSFHELGYFRIGRSSQELDETILGVIQQLVMAGEYRCPNK
jgi:hypothetical protein